MREERKDETYEPEMPDVPEELVFLLEHFQDVGPAEQGDMGPKQLSHREIRSFRKNMGVTLQPWQVRFLRRMSLEYLVEMRKATDPDRPPPWTDPGELRYTTINRVETEQKVRKLFRG